MSFKHSIRVILFFSAFITFLLMGKVALSQNLVINELMTANITSIPDVHEPDYSNCPVADCNSWYQQLGDLTYDGDYPDWIELLNRGTSKINLKGFGLSDSPTNPFKWVFPSIEIPAGGYLVVFASGKDKKDLLTDKYLHTNFKIDRKGESIVLTNSLGVRLDLISAENIPIDLSKGRKKDNIDEWGFLNNPTPGSANNSTEFKGYTDFIQPSHPGGLYAQSIQLLLSLQNKSAAIYYTKDGSDPSIKSTLYSASISLKSTTAIKARGFLNGVAITAIFNETYFVNETFSMPVVSLTTPPDNLWDGDLGIYTAGNNANEGSRIANYWKDWERPCNIEFYNLKGTKGFELGMGMKIFGWGSRANARKSIALAADDKYGDDRINYPIFDDLPIDKFHSLVLRASGSDWQGTLFRDGLVSGLVSNKDIDMQAFLPVILYLNGEYWGIYEMREKLNEDYLAAHHGIDNENVDIISQYWRREEPIVVEGDVAEYQHLIDFLSNNDMSKSENYNRIKSLIDIDNFIDYQVTEIYAANYDWPGNNSKCWRSKTEDQKWRWLLYDLDYTFGSNGTNNYTHNTLEHATNDNDAGWPNPPNTTFLFRKMLDNDNFRDAFINRFADFLNTVFLPENVLQHIDELHDAFYPEMANHIQKWGINNSTRAGINNWENNVADLKEFAEYRPDYLRDAIGNFFGIGAMAKLNLKINLPGAGSIKLNSITIDESLWQGIYYQNIPVEITVIPNKGYQFKSWSGVSLSNNKEPYQLINLATTTTLTANFESDLSAHNSILVNEIYSNGSEINQKSDWVELHSTYSIPVDISGWKLNDEEFSHRYEFPEGTVIAPAGYAVVCQNLSGFTAEYPTVVNKNGQLNFGLNNESDQIVLIDENNQVMDSIQYTNNAPWPVASEGNSISLNSPLNDNSLGENWYTNSDTPTPGEVNSILSGTDLVNDNEGFTSVVFPNPFTLNTTFQFHLQNETMVVLRIFNLTGQLIKTLYNNTLSGNIQHIIWNGDSEMGQPVDKGIYHYQLTDGSHFASGKIVCIRD